MLRVGRRGATGPRAVADRGGGSVAGDRCPV